MAYKHLIVDKEIHEKIHIMKYEYNKNSVSELLSEMIEVYEKYNNEKKVN